MTSHVPQGRWCDLIGFSFLEKRKKGNKGGARLCAFSVAPVVDLVEFRLPAHGASGRSVI